MAFIEIKELHLHVDFKGLDKIASKILSEIFNLKDIMAKTKDELKADFQAAFTEMTGSIANVAADIDRLVENTVPQGGLSEEEVEEQLTQLRSISSALKSVADKTPEPPAPEPEPTPEA